MSTDALEILVRRLTEEPLTLTVAELLEVLVKTNGGHLKLAFGGKKGTKALIVVARDEDALDVEQFVDAIDTVGGAR